MNDNSRSSGGNGLIAVIFLIVSILLGLVGLGAGFFWLARAAPTTSVRNSPQRVIVDNGPPVRLPHRASLALSPLDVKDTMEAPVITITPGGHVLVAFASQTSEDERSLYLVRSTDGDTFSAPQELRKTKIYHSVSQMNGKEVKRAVRLLPQLASGGGKVFLGWLEPNAENTTVYYYVAESTDEGVTFGEPMRVHESEGARPNFISLAADEHGNVAASWLDTRAGIKQPFASVKLAGEAAFQPETQVYSSPNESGVCPCCSTAVVISPDGEVFVAFRNQLDGYRDIYVASRKLAADSEFGPAVPVVEKPTWKFDGCPHDGPTLAIHNNQLHVAWMDASLGQPNCFMASSSLMQLGFSPVKRLFELQRVSEGNARLVSGASGLLAACESSRGTDAPSSEHQHAAAPASDRTINYAQASSDTAIQFGATRGIAPRPGTYRSRPAIASGAEKMFLTFNELDDQGKRVAIWEINP